jgi:hypothetical protein
MEMAVGRGREPQCDRIPTVPRRMRKKETGKTK